jgi:hypothetical protein
MTKGRSVVSMARALRRISIRQNLRLLLRKLEPKRNTQQRLPTTLQAK